MTPVEICRLLIAGSVAAEAVPELNDEDVRTEVRQRLAGVGCELSYARSFDRWVAHLNGPLPALKEHDAIVRLNVADLAVLAACWLHLRFMPSERTRIAVGDEDRLVSLDEFDYSIDPEDLIRQFEQQLDKRYVRIVISNLKKAGFIAQRDGRLFPGPLLDTLNEVTAAERARILLARHQRLVYIRRRAAQRADEPIDQTAPAPQADPPEADNA